MGVVIGGIVVPKEGAGALVGTQLSLHAAHSVAERVACKWSSCSLTCGGMDRAGSRLPYQFQIWDWCKVEGLSTIALAMERASKPFCSRRLLRRACVIVIISESGKHTVGALALGRGHVP